MSDSRQGRLVWQNRRIQPLCHSPRPVSCRQWDGANRKGWH